MPQDPGGYQFSGHADDGLAIYRPLLDAGRAIPRAPVFEDAAEAPPSSSGVRAIVQFDDDRVLVLCPLRHVIESYALDRYFAGSWLESEITRHQVGARTDWDRRAACCQGAGHQLACRAS